MSRLVVLVLVASSCSTPMPMTGDGGADAGSATDAGTMRTLGAERAGLITYYSADGTGNCSYDASPGNLDVAAMNSAEWDNSAVCGSCVRVDGPLGSLVVRVVDQCPDCVSGQLDLSASAFAKVADPAAGRVNVRWQPVSCAVQGPIVFRFKEGSTQWWTGLQVRNTRVPVQSLEVQKNGAWVSVQRESYNYFVDSSGLGTGPFTVRVTGSDGQQLVETGIPLRESAEVSGTLQFQ